MFVRAREEERQLIFGSLRNQGVMASLEEVIRSHPGKTLVLVSHRVVYKVLICAILGLDNSDFWQITQDTTAINRIQCRNEKYILSLLNETCHLKPLKEERIKIDF